MSSELLSDVLRDKVGDYVHVDLQIRDTKSTEPFNPYFDTGSDVRLLINGGGLHPIVHDIASRLTTPGQTITEVRNGGPQNPGAAADIPLASAPGGLSIGDVVTLSNGAKARVTRLTDEALTIDANPPLAGKELEFRLTLQSRKPKSSLESITVAAGCFWGMELAFSRTRGVVYSCTGYTQGATRSPSYEEVCSGRTGHTEAVFALFDPSIVSYAELLKVFWARHDPTQLNAQGNDEGTQYRGGGMRVFMCVPLPSDNRFAARVAVTSPSYHKNTPTHTHTRRHSDLALPINSSLSPSLSFSFFQAASTTTRWSSGCRPRRPWQRRVSPPLTLPLLSLFLNTLTPPHRHSHTPTPRLPPTHTPTPDPNSQPPCTQSRWPRSCCPAASSGWPRSTTSSTWSGSRTRAPSRARGRRSAATDERENGGGDWTSFWTI